MELPEKVAFLGIDKNSIVSIGAYGSMSKQIFKDLENRTTFINIPDWISRKKAGVA